MCDIFIEYQDGDEEEIRFVSVKQAEETANKTIKVLSLEEALKALNLTFEDLNKVDYINEKLYDERKDHRKKRQGEAYYSTGESATTLGDILRSQGIDLIGCLQEEKV